MTDVTEENLKLRRKLEVLKAHGIEIVDAVAGGYEIYSDDHKEVERLKSENAKLREVIDDITEVVEASDPALVWFIAKRMEGAGIEVVD